MNAMFRRLVMNKLTAQVRIASLASGAALFYSGISYGTSSSFLLSSTATKTLSWVTNGSELTKCEEPPANGRPRSSTIASDTSDTSVSPPYGAKSSDQTSFFQNLYGSKNYIVSKFYDCFFECFSLDSGTPTVWKKRMTEREPIERMFWNFVLHMVPKICTRLDKNEAAIKNSLHSLQKEHELEKKLVEKRMTQREPMVGTFWKVVVHKVTKICTLLGKNNVARENSSHPLQKEHELEKKIIDKLAKNFFPIFLLTLVMESDVLGLFSLPGLYLYLAPKIFTGPQKAQRSLKLLFGRPGQALLVIYLSIRFYFNFGKTLPLSIYNDVKDIPLVGGQSLHSKRMCSYLITQYLKTPSKFWNDNRSDRRRGVVQIEEFVLNCKRREMHEAALPKNELIPIGGVSEKFQRQVTLESFLKEHNREED